MPPPLWKPRYSRSLSRAPSDITMSSPRPDEKPYEKRRRMNDYAPSRMSYSPSLADYSSSWIDQALNRAKAQRRRLGEQDPSPLPQVPQGFRRAIDEPHESKYPLPLPVPQRQPASPFVLSPDMSGFLGVPGFSSQFRRSPSVAFTESSFGSYDTLVPPTRYESTPARGSSADFSAFPELGLDSRAASLAPPDYGDTTATFELIYDVPDARPAHRGYTSTSKFERLSEDIFMRILKYCDYKAILKLRRCNYRFWYLINLDHIPWPKMTAALLHEERDNPKNFPQKVPKTRSARRTSQGEGEGGGVGDGEGEGDARGNDDGVHGSEQATTTARAQRPQTRKKSDPCLLGNWACFSCFKILPPHYFEGPLLEDEDGRNARQPKNRKLNAANTDKKVDMRVEYIQVLRVVQPQPAPEWFFQDQRPITATDVESYVRQRGERGCVRDDLRAYYHQITRERYLVAPLRGVMPVFAESAHAIARIDQRDLAAWSRRQMGGGATDEQGQGGSSSMAFSSVSAGEVPPGCETYRPLYRQDAPERARLRGDSEIGRHFYELRIPHGSLREPDRLELPSITGTNTQQQQQQQEKQQQSTTNSCGRVVLPQKASCDATEYLQPPVVQVHDVISLRRICIPCGAKYGVYRRDCNRKIVSKTGEEWWVCACPRVRQTGKCRGCPDCGRRTIY